MAFKRSAPADAVSDENFAELLNQFDPLIKRVARRSSYYLIGSDGAAGDLAQDIRCHLVDVLRNDPVSDAAFVRKIVTNAIRSRIRSERRRLQLGSANAHELDERLPELRGQAPDVARKLSVSMWLSTLPARLRIVFDVLYVRGYTQREASTALNISQPRIAQLHRELLERGRMELSTLAA